MAHVLLPCELPFWPEVQAQISALRRSRDVAQVISVLRSIYRICSAAVEQVDEDRASEDEMRFDLCEAFLEDFEDTSQLLNVILPTVVDFARRIEDCRPQHFIYSLQAEEGSWNLSREFVASLLAHSLLSTFPLRTLRSHPTLQDFNRCSTYRYLTSDQHKRFLTNLLRYFKEVRSQMDGYIRVTRRILVRCPPLTEWVCGTAPLCPLTVRHVASMDDAEPYLYRVLPVNANLAVLKHVKCAENEFLLEHPELSVLQLFCEALKENEVLVVEGLRLLRVQSKLKQTLGGSSKASTPGKLETTHLIQKSTSHRGIPLLPSEEYRLNSCEELGLLGLLDVMTFDREFLYRQYLDETLIYNLNKCLNAFQQATRSASSGVNQDPVGDRTTTTEVVAPQCSGGQPRWTTPSPLPTLSFQQSPAQQLQMGPHTTFYSVGETRSSGLQTTDSGHLKQRLQCENQSVGSSSIHKCPHILSPLTLAGGSSPDKSSQSSPFAQGVIGDMSDKIEFAGTSVKCSECILASESASVSKRPPSPVFAQSSTSSSFSLPPSDEDSHEAEENGESRQQHSNKMVVSGNRPCVRNGSGTGIGVPRHLLTYNLLQTQALLNLPKHPSPRPRKRTVSGSTSTGADDSEATLLNRPVGQPLMLPRSPPQVQPLEEKVANSASTTVFPGYIGKRPPSLTLMSRAQVVLSAPPVSSPRRIPSLQSEDSRGSFRTDSGEQRTLAYRPSRKAQGHGSQDGMHDSTHTNCQLHRSLSKTSRASSFKTTLSKRCSRQVSAEDDYFTAEESFEEDDEDRALPDKVSKTMGQGATGQQVRSLHKKKSWRTAYSRSSRTFDSELEGPLILQSSVDYPKEPLGPGRHLLREDSAGSAGFVLEQRSGCSRRSDSDIASSAGRLFYRERAERGNSQFMSVDSASNNCTCTNGGRLKGGGRRYHRQLGGLRVTQGQSSKSRSHTHRSLDRRHSSECSSCCGSSMEDIVEDPELLSPMLNPLHPLCSPLLFRRANSEPYLSLSAAASCFTTATGDLRANRTKSSINRSDGSAPADGHCIPPTALTRADLSGCRLRNSVLSICIGGRPVPKAYSFDGVNPNLPVPFKAKFRIRKKRSPSAECDMASRHALTKEDLDYIKRVVRVENRPRSLTESQDSSRIHEMQRNNELNQKISPSLAEGPSGMLPVACTRWTADAESETDAQLEALSLWLAASVAGLPHLVIYTHGESRLQHLDDVCSKAMERGWLCGDLAGELVRFCRNKMSIHRGVGRVSTELSLFMQILQPKPS
ncbi:uncharacterized protein LOC111262001 [Varroa jacobsoni]|uniref:uncharacterized protein LOC111262001 n=1 Tax=Varroa jacobsoni TaxID=62625 RepID=UPI000BF4A28F|nr:uncharacterized protein LOC111262001 [Varroa jacobsoni]